MEEQRPSRLPWAAILMAAHTNPGVVVGHVKAGKMRILGIASEKRLDVLPNVPTYREQGIPLVLFQWRGVACGPGHPRGGNGQIDKRSYSGQPDARVYEVHEKYQPNLPLIWGG